MQFSLTRQYFCQLLRQEAPFSLTEASLYIALEEYPDLDISVYLQRLDAMAEDVSQKLPCKPDRGVLYYQLGRWVEARQDLEEYFRTNSAGSGSTFNDSVIGSILRTVFERQRQNEGFSLHIQ